MHTLRCSKSSNQHLRCKFVTYQKTIQLHCQPSFGLIEDNCLEDSSPLCYWNTTKDWIMKGDDVLVTCNISYSNNSRLVIRWNGFNESRSSCIDAQSSVRTCTVSVVVHSSTLSFFRSTCSVSVMLLDKETVIHQSRCEYERNVSVHFKPKNISLHPIKRIYNAGDSIVCSADSSPPSKFSWVDECDRTVANTSTVSIWGRTNWLQCIASNMHGWVSINVSVSELLPVNEHVWCECSCAVVGSLIVVVFIFVGATTTLGIYIRSLKKRMRNLEVQLRNTAITSEYSEIGNRNISQHTPQYTPLTGAEVREVGEDAIPRHREPTYANRFIPGGGAEDHHSSEATVPEHQVFNDDKFQSAIQIGSTKSNTGNKTVVYKNVIVYENLLDK